MKRRNLLAAGGLAFAGVAAMAGYRTRQPGFDLRIPAVPTGDERLERRDSRMRGLPVDFYTAVPAGHGDGKGLPVCLIMHGNTAQPADFRRLGLGRFLTDAVQRGAPPFVLAGASGGKMFWRPRAGDDPQRMIREEVPVWCKERGFDAETHALWGWSAGGYGALLLAEGFPGFARAVAAFSPAVSPRDDVFVAARQLRGTPVGLWCGEQDPLYPNVRAFAAAMPDPPAAGSYGDGRHNFGYWSRCIPSAFGFIAAHLRT